MGYRSIIIIIIIISSSSGSSSNSVVIIIIIDKGWKGGGTDLTALQAISTPCQPARAMPVTAE